MKKVFITGVAGFLGSHLADAFLARGYHVAGMDNLVGGYKDNIPKDVQYIEGDLLNFNDLSKSLKAMISYTILHVQPMKDFRYSLLP